MWTQIQKAGVVTTMTTTVCPWIKFVMERKIVFQTSLMKILVARSLQVWTLYHLCHCLENYSDLFLIQGETDCNSWYGRKHFKCPNNDRCVEVNSDCEQETLSLINCTTNQGRVGIRCLDGQCLDTQHICNGEKNCMDGSDEREGCNLFPETGELIISILLLLT